MKKEITCIICPRGCLVTVLGGPGLVEEISGHQCGRGEKYARQEFLDPRRILTSSVLLTGPGRALLPVRSSRPLPRDLLLPAMEVIRRCRISPPVGLHQVIVTDILGTGVDMISCLPLEQGGPN